jgi:uncharacterized protein DUF4129
VSRAAKAGALAFALVGLLLVVALASRGGHPTTDGRISTRAVPATLQDSLVTLLAIAYVLAIIAIVLLFFRRRPWHEPQDSRWLRNYVSVLALMLLVTLFGFWAIRHGHFRQQNEQAQRGQGDGQTQRPGQLSPSQPLRTRAAEFQWPLALGIAGLVVLGGVLLVVNRRRALPVVADGESMQEGLARAVETTIDDLRREPDPRRAVIAAYANMEGALASRGLARRGAETPFEYLARILHELKVRDSAVRSLTRLFEYAKFSPHEIGEEMREDAITALLAVREDLLAEERAAA